MVALGPYEFLLNKEKILIHDSVWRSLTDIPLKGEQTSWDKVEIRVVRRKYFLEVSIWSEPQGETSVQSLHWFVFAARGKTLEKVVDQIVSRRRPHRSQFANKTFIQDPVEKHGLESAAEGIRWRAGRNSGLLQE
jgi:hypothetical protein